MRAKVYDWMYRHDRAPWDPVGVRKDLVDLLNGGEVTPARYPRSIDLGCGTGANVVYLAQRGFDSWGVDFSEVAITKARQRAAEARAEAHVVLGDFTADEIPGIEGTFDFLIDFGGLDDLKRAVRRKMAATINRLSRPGSKFLEYCFYRYRWGDPFSLGMQIFGMPSIVPGELEALFGESWAIEPFASYREWRTAAFLLTRLSEVSSSDNDPTSETD